MTHTTPAGWPHADSPFHPGEQEMQRRVGVRDKIEGIGRRVVRDYMPEQHREFFAQLPFIVAGAVDENGVPWATLWSGEPGFLSSPDPQRLRIGALPLPGDPLEHAVTLGAAFGLLGIEPHSRRRNRMNGTVESLDDTGFTVRVAQSFGNCPKYIRKRYAFDTDDAPPAAPERLDALDAAAVAAADTFFIASYFRDGEASPSLGVDVSHRGGEPGFVRVDNAGTLTWPDYAGNLMFNTLGNLIANPRAGLVFPDFETGELLHVAGRGEIVWDGDEVSIFEGAERLVRFRVDSVVRRPAALPLRFIPAD
ncbi:pyridoxamine 5'-phosphate oxidase family protein [Crenobacter cavernae]|uniref:Flavin-nucleotide-binding protein n=1 Tax=Crenobacter cavernae TaxID=2290923 RepID=A0A345Y2F5_9NEIS|nr:pyridoxamine 5'-phosphate oxidase family protein [Crenobacter cavernae]AXK38107.1 flavin-nucleotide-binding protein [Crenobacter cavernae]